MASNTSCFSSRLNSHSQKRKLDPESSSTNDEDLESSRNNSSQLLCQLESKNREFEERMNSMYTKFNQELTLQMQKLQQQYEQVLSRIDGFENRLRHIETMNQDMPQHVYNPKQDSREMKPTDTNINQLTKCFEERFDLVDLDNQTITERLDTCQQKCAQMSVKTESFENQLVNLQQRLNNIEIHDTNMQQLAEEDTYQNPSTTVETKLTDGMNTSKEQLHNDDDGCDLVEKALCTPCESQIPLSTDQVQYGRFDVSDKYNVILIKEDDKLKLFDHQEQIDERPGGERERSNYVTCIHWCSFLDTFLILYRFNLYTLSLKRNQETSKMQLDDLKPISSIRAYPLRYDTTNRTEGNPSELLRFITTSPNIPGYLYLNRGYRRVELVNTNSWRSQRGWSKRDLEYGERDEIRSIKLSYDGTYLAMNIRRNDRLGFIDLRKHDDQLTLMKTIRMPKNSASLSYRVQIPFGERKWWLIVDEKNQCYKVSADPNDQSIIPIRTDHVQAIENVQIRVCFVRDNRYLLVGEVIGDHKDKQGVFRFYKLPV